MKKEHDIERLLLRHPIQPGPDVRRAVMAHFSASRGRRERRGLWMRAIPAYAAAAAVILAVIASFLAGRWSAPTASPEKTGAPATMSIRAASWEPAANDLL